MHVIRTQRGTECPVISWTLRWFCSCTRQQLPTPHKATVVIQSTWRDRDSHFQSLHHLILSWSRRKVFLLHSWSQEPSSPPRRTLKFLCIHDTKVSGPPGGIETVLFTQRDNDRNYLAWSRGDPVQIGKVKTFYPFRKQRLVDPLMDNGRLNYERCTAVLLTSNRTVIA